MTTDRKAYLKARDQKRNSRDGCNLGARKATLRARDMTPLAMALGWVEVGPYPEGVERPKTRGECAGGERPCPFVSCGYHLYLDVNDSGGIVLNFPDLEPHEMVESCALDAAERGGMTLDAVGAAMNWTRERSRQVEVDLLKKLRPKAKGLR